LLDRSLREFFRFPNQAHDPNSHARHERYDPKRNLELLRDTHSRADDDQNAGDNDERDVF